MKEITKALLNLGSETVIVRYQHGKTITGSRHFVDVFSNTVILKTAEDNSFHKIDFENIDHVILKSGDMESKLIQRQK